MSAENISYDLKRFAGIKRDYSEEEVERLRGSIKIEYSLCKNQSQKLMEPIKLGSLTLIHLVHCQVTKQFSMLKQD
jgi:isocitrate lyase